MPQGTWSEYPIEVVWEGGKRYRGGRPGGASIVMDGSRESGPSPVETLVASIGACSAIDVVEILAKRRTPAARLEVGIEFARADTPPRRLTAARITYRVTTASERHHVERAIDLALVKYCSVTASLAPDTDIRWELELVPTAETG